MVGKKKSNPELKADLASEADSHQSAHLHCYSKDGDAWFPLCANANLFLPSLEEVPQPSGHSGSAAPLLWAAGTLWTSNKTELCQRLAADGQTSAFLQSAPTTLTVWLVFPANKQLTEVCEDHSKESHESHHPRQQALQAKGVLLFLQWMAPLKSEAEGHWSYPMNKWGLCSSFRPCMLGAQHSCDWGDVLQLKDLPCVMSQVLPCACSSENWRQALVLCNEMKW